VVMAATEEPRPAQRRPARQMTGLDPAGADSVGRLDS
jgi:hypothetical protein